MIAGLVSNSGEGEEFHGDAVVFFRVVHRVRAGDWYAGVAGAVEEQGGCGDSVAWVMGD
jgi:hypothetical protein